MSIPLRPGRVIVIIDIRELDILSQLQLGFI